MSYESVDGLDTALGDGILRRTLDRSDKRNDLREGFAAFREKRPAEFRGR